MDKKMILLALIFSLILIGSTVFGADVPPGQAGGAGPLTGGPQTLGRPEGAPPGAPAGQAGGAGPLTGGPQTLGNPMGTPPGAPPTTEQGGAIPMTGGPNTLGSPVFQKSGK